MADKKTEEKDEKIDKVKKPTKKETAKSTKTTPKAEEAKEVKDEAKEVKAQEKPEVKAEADKEKSPEVKSHDSSVSNLVGRPMTEEAVESRPAATPMARVERPIVRRPMTPVRPSRPPVKRGQVDFVGGRKVWRSNVATQPMQFVPEETERVGGGEVQVEEITGFLDLLKDGNGILRSQFSGGDKDAYISGTQIRRLRLRPGDSITGPARKPKESEQFWGLLKVDLVNGVSVEDAAKRVRFEKLTPVYPDEKIVLETETDVLSTRLIDLVAPVGRGQRGMIVSSPKAGKTTVLKDISTGAANNYKDIHVMAVLVGERPEEVTDIKRHIEAVTGGKGEVAASNFDEPASEQVRVAELALERAKRMVETGRHVLIIMDSITRLARAYNLAIPTSGRTLSGGFDPAALYPPKRFFGAARNFEEFETPDGNKNGSLTILGTALIDTGSKMDDLIYEEFKGTGNMELHLDRQLAERRIWPAIDVQRSGTRREDLLFDNTTYQGIVLMRRMIDMLDPKERTPVIVARMKNTKNNKELLASLKEG